MRTAFIRQKGRLLLCVNGEAIFLAPQYRDLTSMITDQTEISYPQLQQHALFREFCDVLCGLYNKGIYRFQ